MDFTQEGNARITFHERNTREDDATRLLLSRWKDREIKIRNFLRIDSKG